MTPSAMKKLRDEGSIEIEFVDAGMEPIENVDYDVRLEDTVLRQRHPVRHPLSVREDVQRELALELLGVVAARPPVDRNYNARGIGDHKDVTRACHHGDRLRCYRGKLRHGACRGATSRTNALGDCQAASGSASSEARDPDLHEYAFVVSDH